MAAPDTSTANGRREQRRQRHQDLSRGQILDAAEEVFGRKGFHATTLKEIVELAEFSVGSVYSFFDSKDDLFQQIFLRRGEEYMPRVNAVLSGRGTALELLHDLVEFEIGWFREHPHFGRLWLRHSHTAPEPDAAIGVNYAETMQLQADLFARGQAEGVFAAGDPGVLARLLSGLVAAFQQLDPLVMSDDPEAVPPMTLNEFHALIQRTFTS